MLDQVLDFTRQHCGRWLQLWGTNNAAGVRLGEPLFFHHVAKTGGTSLIQAIRAVTPPRLCFTERGNLSAPFVDALVARGLVPGQFIHGHPGTGAAQPLRGRARIVTLLREPCDQVISNYFWLRKDWRVPAHDGGETAWLPRIPCDVSVFRNIPDSFSIRRNPGSAHRPHRGSDRPAAGHLRVSRRDACCRDTGTGGQFLQLLRGGDWPARPAEISASPQDASCQPRIALFCANNLRSCRTIRF